MAGPHRTCHASAWLGLAAAPTFAAMALLTGVAGGPAADICASASGLGPLAGMPAMYGLMGVFHLGPWLRLVSRRPGRAGPAEISLAGRPGCRR